MLTLVGVVLLIRLVIIDAPFKHTAPVVKADAWLEFVSHEFAIIVFDEAPALVIRLELIRPVPADNDEGDGILTTDEEPDGPWQMRAYDPLRWLDGHAPPLRSFVDPSRIQYTLDPAFGFENRALRIKGMMIRLRIEF